MPFAWQEKCLYKRLRLKRLMLQSNGSFDQLADETDRSHTPTIGANFRPDSKRQLHPDGSACLVIIIKNPRPPYVMRHPIIYGLFAHSAIARDESTKNDPDPLPPANKTVDCHVIAFVQLGLHCMQ